MHISSAKFDRSAPSLDLCPGADMPEFAFIGRSNVGKSSLLNLLAGKEGLARVSPTPGFTKWINCFTINRCWRLVDLPGYGFAQVSKHMSSAFNEAVSEYLENRENLLCIFALVEGALPPQALDLEFLQWLTSRKLPFVIVFTKADKVPPPVLDANREAFLNAISPWFVQPPSSLVCSAENRSGRAELLELISSCLQENGYGDGNGPRKANLDLQSPEASLSPRPPKKHRPDLNRPW